MSGPDLALSPCLVRVIPALNPLGRKRAMLFNKTKHPVSTLRGGGTWPDGEPQEIRDSADALNPTRNDELDDCDDSADALNRTLYPLSIGALVSVGNDLLRDDAADLPRPRY